MTLHSTKLNGHVPMSVCDNRDLKGGRLRQLSADCDGDIPKVICACCTFCFETPPTIKPTVMPTIKPTAMPTVVPTETPTTRSPAPTTSCKMDQDSKVSLIFSILASVSEAEALKDEGSAQGKALDWILYHDEALLCPDSDTLIQRYVMALFYFATNGDRWNECSSGTTGTLCSYAHRFLDSASECTWAGVTCDNGVITKIEFGKKYWLCTLSIFVPGESHKKLASFVCSWVEDNNLAGYIPSEISFLVELQALNLERGLLSGHIPSSLGRLTKLRELDLDNNILSGSIPHELSGAPQLWLLDLNDNFLSGDIDALQNMPSLKYVQLHSTSVSGTVPSSLGDLEELGKKASSVPHSVQYCNPDLNAQRFPHITSAHFSFILGVQINRNIYRA